MSAREQEPERPEDRHVSASWLETLMQRDYLPQVREMIRQEMERAEADIHRHFNLRCDQLEKEVERLRNHGWAVWLAVVAAGLALIGRMAG